MVLFIVEFFRSQVQAFFSLGALVILPADVEPRKSGFGFFLFGFEGLLSFRFDHWEKVDSSFRIISRRAQIGISYGRIPSLFRSNLACREFQLIASI